VPLTFPNSTAEDRTAQSSRRAIQPGTALRPLHFWRLASLEAWHLTSLDAPTVALVWACSFAWATGTHLQLKAAAVIVLAVWTVYVGDRLLDARSSLRQHAEHRLRERHYFHWRHRRILAPMAVLAAVAVAILVLACIPVVARERDSVLAAASLAYFARVHHSQLSTARTRRPFFPPLVTKELLVGVLFAVGCALPSLGAAWTAQANTRWVSRGIWISNPILIGCIAFFATLAWLNCHAIERWESQTLHTTDLSLAGFALGLALLGLGAALMLFSAHPRPALLLASAALSALMIALLDRIRPQLAPITLRAAADLVLLAPAVVIFVARPIAGLVR
jgi:hypothetical protein